VSSNETRNPGRRFQSEGKTTSSGSLTIFVDNDFNEAQPICAVYSPGDGYLSVHGKRLKAFLTGFQITNGLPGPEGSKFANGCGCLAAQVIAHFKQVPGRIYMHPMPITQDAREAYHYIVTTKSEEPIWLTVDALGEQIYDGPLDSFDPQMRGV